MNMNFFGRIVYSNYFSCINAVIIHYYWLNVLYYNTYIFQVQFSQTRIGVIRSMVALTGLGYEDHYV